MFPVIFAFGPVTISTLGVFITIGFIMGGFSIWKKMKEEHFDNEEIFDFIFLSIIGGLIFGRIIYIVSYFDKFGFVWGKWINVSSYQGLMWLGFLFGVVYIIKIISRKKKWNIYQILDLSAYGFLIANIYVRIGEFFNASYIGIETSLPIGLQFPGFETYNHPLQLYDSLILLIILFILKWLDNNYRLFSWYQDKRGNAQPGFIWLSYIMLFSITQFIFDFIKYNRGIVLGVISIYQIILIITLLISGFNIWLKSGRENPFTKFIDNILPDDVAPIRKPMNVISDRKKKAMVAKQRRFKRRSS